MLEEGERRNYTAYNQLLIDGLQIQKFKVGPDVQLGFNSRDLPHIADAIDRAMFALSHSPKLHIRRQELAVALRYPLALPDDFSGLEKATNTYSEVGAILPRHSNSGLTEVVGYGVSYKLATQITEAGLVRIMAALWKNPGVRSSLLIPQ